jgi:rod shape-determining protein MreC
LYYLFSLSPIDVIHTVSASITYPFLRLQKIIVDPIKKWSSERVTLAELHATIDTLRTEQEATLAENIRLQSTLAYYKDVEELLAFNERYANKGYVSQILVKQFSSREHSFLVQGGLTQGITKDMVATYKNNLIGRVVEVYPWYSKVQLITDGACQVAAYCTRTRAQGIHKGAYNNHETLLDFVSHLEKLHVGDLVVSSGQGLVFPQGFALGTIISYVPEDLYQQVRVKPIVDLLAIKYCTLLAKK